MKIKLLIFSLLLFSSSCMTHRHSVGDGPIGTKGKTKIYSRAKQAYLFWGLMPLGRPSPSTPSHGDYQIKTGFNVGDTFLGVITFGIVTFRTIRIITFKEGESLEGRLHEKMNHHLLDTYQE